MPLVKVIRGKGAVVTVEASAEVLFTPAGPAGNYSRRLTRLARASISTHAPGNKRPTWGHEPAAQGKTLKSSIKASSSYRTGSTRIFTAVGSAAPYSAYVDQGTGIYRAGGSPWKAKILPPRTSGGSDLYEHTWRFSKGEQTVREVWIKGQRPQRFFAAGVNDALKAMGLPTVTVPGDVGTSVFPPQLVQHVTSAIGYGKNSAFAVSLAQWRAQRDAAWNRNEILGQTNSTFSRRNTRAAADLREQRRQAVAAKRAKKASTKAARPTAVAVRPTMTNQEKYLASKAAADARRNRETAELRRQRQARAMSDKRKAAQEAKRRAEQQVRNNNVRLEAARRDAYAYAQRLRPAYPNIEVLVSKANGLVRVRWTDSTGEMHRQDFS